MNRMMNDKEKMLLKQEIEDKTGLIVFLDEPMKKHTTFKIGGNADIYVKVEDIENLLKVFNIAKENNLQITYIGRGSNILVLDGGIRGIVVELANTEFSYFVEDGKHYVKVGAGETLSNFCKKVNALGLGPMHNIFGIPGSVGGALMMNAGAYGTEINEFVRKTTYLDENGNIKELVGEEHLFGYRDSFFKHNNVVILETIMEFQKVNKEEDLKLMLDTMQKRTTNQPLDYPSAGSVFKRGKDFIVSRLLDELGLKGTKVGGAELSTKHAGFIVNKGDATAKDVLELIAKLKQEVKEKANKQINMEVIILGEE